VTKSIEDQAQGFHRKVPSALFLLFLTWIFRTHLRWHFVPHRAHHFGSLPHVHFVICRRYCIVWSLAEVGGIKRSGVWCHLDFWVHFPAVALCSCSRSLLGSQAAVPFRNLIHFHGVISPVSDPAPANWFVSWISLLHCKWVCFWTIYEKTNTYIQYLLTSW